MRVYCSTWPFRSSRFFLMVSTHPSGSFFSSLAKNLSGRMPFASNSQNCRSSRAMFVRILFFQYSGSFSSRPSFNFPCQKSPSTNTAIFCRGKNTSGVPGTPLRCFLYRNSGQKRFMSEKSCFSGPVFLDLIRRMTSDRFSGVNMSVTCRRVRFQNESPVIRRRGLIVRHGAPGRNRTYILAFGGPYSIR